MNDFERVANAIVSVINEWGKNYEPDKEKVLSVLPLAGDKTQSGKTRRQILIWTSLEPKRISSLLQSLKRQHKVKCNQRRWRQTKQI